jgi:transposase
LLVDGFAQGFGQNGADIKKKTLYPSELTRPDIRIARAQWAKAQKSVPHHRFLFIDESGAKTNMTRLYGRGLRGNRVYCNVPNGRWETTTMIAAIGRNGPQAPWVVEGPMDGEVFTVWAQQVLAPTLEPGDIVVMDNLSVHKNKMARKAIEAAGAQIWDLPAYSPDLNPIEKMWSKIKAHLRKVEARDPESLFCAIGDAIAQVSNTDIKNWFASCGYSLS